MSSVVVKSLWRITRSVAPPLLWLAAREIAHTFVRRPKGVALGFAGSFSNFDDAKASDSTIGYDGEATVETALKQGTIIKHAAQSADSRMNSRNIRLLAALAAKRPTSVLDFGGAFGSHYFYLRPHLPQTPLRWVVVEQTKLVVKSAPFFSDELSFSSDLNQALTTRFDLALASGSLQYVRGPLEILKALSEKCGAIIIDRIPFSQLPDHRVTIQKVTAPYRGSYPAWFFSREKWEAEIASLGLTKKLSWDVPEDGAQWEFSPIRYEGCLLVPQNPA